METKATSSQRRVSRVSTTVAHEATPMLEEGVHNAALGVDHPDVPKYSNCAKMLTCHCPPDADFPYLNLKEFRFLFLLLSSMKNLRFCFVKTKVFVLLLENLKLKKNWVYRDLRVRTGEKFCCILFCIL